MGLIVDGFISAFRNMLEKLDIDLVSIKEEGLLDDLESISSQLTTNIRDDNYENLILRCMIAYVLHELAKKKYGAPDPLYSYNYQVNLTSSKWSKVCPLMDDHSVVAICIGPYIKTWWDLVYEIAHETIHTLSPLIDPLADYNALEEGVAVKFAEDVYAAYYSDFSPIKIPASSPKNSYNSNNNYLTAYKATDKLSDELLLDVRNCFSGFGRMNDFEKFNQMVGGFLSNKEIKILFDSFKDPSNRKGMDPSIR